MKKLTVVLATMLALCGFANPVQAVAAPTAEIISSADVVSNHARAVSEKARLASEESTRQLEVAETRQKEQASRSAAVEQPVQHAQAAKGYNSPDDKYAKVCAADAREKATTVGATYSQAAGYDYPPSVSDSSTPSFPPAFRNPVRKEQYIHPIEFKVRMVRGFETRIRVMYSNSDIQSSNGCVFQGIEFLDMTDAN